MAKSIASKKIDNELKVDEELKNIRSAVHLALEKVPAHLKESNPDSIRLKRPAKTEVIEPSQAYVAQARDLIARGLKSAAKESGIKMVG